MKHSTAVILGLVGLFGLALALEDAQFHETVSRIQREVDSEFAKRSVNMKKRHSMKHTPVSTAMGKRSVVVSRAAEELGMTETEIISKRQAPSYGGPTSSDDELECPITRPRRRTIPVGNVFRDNLDFNLPACGNRETENQFRTADGTCNNLNNPHWGRTLQPFRRLVENTYADGKSAPTDHLPNPREVSTSIHPDMILPDVRITNMLMQMGQFLDHDVSLAPEDDLECCGDESSNKECFNIPVPNNDGFFSVIAQPPQTCLPFTRTTPLCSDSKVREQFNLITSLVDLSNIYGSEARIQNFVRRGRRGLLQENRDKKLRRFLPTVKEATGQEHFENVEGTFFSGDIRVNEMPGLAVMHTLFFREHNRLARQIYRQNNELSDDQIFNLARRINVAEWQQVVYGEFLPVVVGPVHAKLFLLDTAEDSLYFNFVNPGIFHSFATAAYRMGHTLINGIVEKFKDGVKVDSYQLRNNFFESGEIVEEDGDGLERIMEGLINQPGQSFDEFITEEVTNHLFQEHGHNFGQDLIARNLQRARDHGLGSYSELREVCGFPSMTSNWDTSKPDEIPQSTWNKLRQLYNSPRDIELFTGGASEVPSTSAVVGPTFACLISYQFFLLKFGDRFFYTHQCRADYPRAFPRVDEGLINALKEGNVERKINRAMTDEDEDDNCNRYERFSEAERTAIRGRRLGDIICDNTRTIGNTTEYVNLVISGSNRVSTCRGRDRLDVSIFM